MPEDEEVNGSSTLKLSVVVPVFNQASSIVGNLETIRERVASKLGHDFEIVVVSDGSIDATESELLERQKEGGFRVFHYDRNLGKGYAVKLGALEAFGEWIGFVDADLDLDPADLGDYVRKAEEDQLDFAIGSKRHPDSDVHYPRSRVVASWLFQQLVRLLFHLDVKDTQVGLKIFRREVAEQVLPLLLVKRYAFDIELLAVARAFGFERIEEMPVRLDYQFTGSGVRSTAVLRALVDTAAIFYRLRILRYYQRRRALSGAYGWTRPKAHAPLVSVILQTGSRFRERDYTNIEIVELEEMSSAALAVAARAARGDVLAILEPGGNAAANWLSATVPFLHRRELGAVVTPKMAPVSSSVLANAAAAVDESRIGAGVGYFRYTPGNVRYVSDYLSASLVVRREAFLGLPEGTGLPDVVAALDSRGWRVLYTPESVVVAEPPHLFGPHLAMILHRGRRYGAAVRRHHQLKVRVVPLAAALAVCLLVAILALLGGRDAGGIVAVLAALYAAGVLIAAGAATLRYQSLKVGLATIVGIVCTHVVYVVAFVIGVATRR